jgi:hypothetical protein
MSKLQDASRHPLPVGEGRSLEGDSSARLEPPSRRFRHIFSADRPSYALIKVHETRTNVIGLLDGVNVDSAVADISGSGSLDDHSDDVIYLVVVRDDFDHDFGQEHHVVFEPAINEGMSTLPPMTTDFGDCHAGDNVLKRSDHVVELFRPDDTLDRLHSL